MNRRRIAIVTTSRADYGLYRPLLKRLAADPAVELCLIVGGMHVRPEFGDTIRDIAADGLAIAERVDHLDADDSPPGIARALGRGVIGYGEALARQIPDLAVVLGDRFEMLAAALAAQPLGIPLAHLHGGELSLGVLDDAFRHAITKLSHLHLVSTEAYARRVRQMGEEDWRVTVSGAPGLDNLDTIDRLSGAALAERIGLALDPPPLLVTYHPVTLDPTRVEQQAGALLEALDRLRRPVVLTAPNADAGGRRMAAMMRDYVATHAEARYAEHLGTAAYFGLMGAAAAMVGNSSSGILEAASFALPVVNIGPRQDGRLRAANVIDVAEDATAIIAGLERALSPAFRAGLRGLVNPYRGPGSAAEVIHQVLMRTPIDDRLRRKRFIDRD